MYRRIAVPVDGTATSQQAILWAATIARRAQCPIELVHVAFPPAAGTELYAATVIQPKDAEAIRHLAQRDLQALADHITSTGVTANATVVTGELPDALSDQLERSDSDLVVMTTHDPNRIERLLIGSVAESVVRHVHIPILLVPQTESATTPPTAVRGIQKLLIPLDGSSFGNAILPHATALASLLSTEVTLVAVMQPILALAATAADVAGPSGAVIPLNVHEDDPEARQTEVAKRALEDTAASLRSRGLAVRTEVLVDGQPARAIVDYARRNGLDAIAMTTHGRGALKRIVAGSVSQRVLRTSHLPMLMYRPSDQAVSSTDASG
jgi:nucleotide-binding universal stress UspA family protein